MSKYKKVQLIALIVMFLTLVMRGIHRFAVALPDWAVRLNGVIMLAACAVMVFASVRLAMRADKND